MNKGKRTKQVAKTALNVTIMISFFATIAAIIWLVWEPRVIVLNVVATALTVLVTTWQFKLVLLVEKDLWR